MSEKLTDEQYLEMVRRAEVGGREPVPYKPASEIQPIADYPLSTNVTIDSGGNPPDMTIEADEPIAEKSLRGETTGDMMYWDDEEKEWIILPAPTAGVMKVLSFDPSGAAIPEWIDTEDCP